MKLFPNNRVRKNLGGSSTSRTGHNPNEEAGMQNEEVKKLKDENGEEHDEFFGESLLTSSPTFYCPPQRLR